MAKIGRLRGENGQKDDAMAILPVWCDRFDAVAPQCGELQKILLYIDYSPQQNLQAIFYNP